MRRRKEPRNAVHAAPTAHTAADKDALHVHCPPQHSLSTGDVAAMAILASGTLLGYTLTLYPSIAGGDSGELVAESCHLGVSHPPGYPLFNMVVHLFTQYLPFGDTPAWRANFFSAVCDTEAVVLIYLSLLRWTAPTNWRGRRVAAFTAAALFGFSPLIWTYAVGAEVFALNNAFAALLVYQLLQYAQHHDKKSALMGAFTCGLAMCNQHTIVLFELPIVLWVLWTRRYTLWWKEFAQFTGAFVAGLTPYIYMPVAAIWNPQPGSWGDVTTLSGLFHHIRRADYGTFRLYSSNESNEGLWTRLRLYGVDLSSREIPFQLALPVIALGVLQSIRPSAGMNRPIGWFMIAMYAFYMLVFHSLANLPISEGLIYGVQMRFWQQPNVVVFVWFGIGLAYVANVVARIASNDSKVTTMTLRILSQVGCLALVGAQIWRWHELCDQSRAFYIRNYAQALLDPLPPKAVLFVNFDLQWTSLRYLQRCEHRRPDVTVLNLSMMTYGWFASKHLHYPNLKFPGSRLVPFGSAGGFSLAALLDANMGAQRTRPRFFLGGKLNYNDQDFNEKYTLVPYGLLDEFQSQAVQPRSLTSWYSSQQKVKALVRKRLPTLPPEAMYNDETWEWTIARDHGMKELSWATYLLDRTIAEDPQNLSLLREAAKPMEASYQLEPPQFWNEASNLKNLGLAYAQMVKSSHEFPTSPDPFFNAVVGASVEDPTRFKDRASSRMLEVWDAWLQVPEAKHDPGYKPIQNVVRQFLPARAEPARATATKKQRRKQKKKRTSTTKASNE